MKMKRAITIPFLSILFVTGPGVLTSCSITHENKVTGPATTRVVNISDGMTKLVSFVSADIEYRTGKPGIKIKGPEDEVNLIQVKQKGTTLELSREDRDKNYHKFQGVQIELSLPELNSITLNGSGDISAPSIVATTFDLKLLGSGDIEIGDVEANTVKISCSGAGDVSIGKITTPQLQFFSQGAGDIEIGNVSATSVDATLQGAGDLTLKYVEATVVDILIQGANDADLPKIDVTTLRATVQGAGDLTVGGRAANARLTVQGAGDINAGKLDADRVTRNEQGVGKIHL